MPRLWLIFLGSGEASEQSSLLPHSPPAMLGMLTISLGTRNTEPSLPRYLLCRQIKQKHPENVIFHWLP